MPNLRAHVFVSGQVQGVNFRLKTQRLAESLNVTGWVRNLTDGRVEAVFEGEEEPVNKLVEFCHHGPAYAFVTDVQVSWETYRGEFEEFDAL